MQKPNTPIKALLIFLLKVSLGILAFVLIASMIRLRVGGQGLRFVNLWQGAKSLFLIVGLMVMGMLNLLLEAIKWRFLIYKVERISFLNSCKSLLSGLSLALFTPGRLGEFGGRVLYLKPENRKPGAYCILVGNLSQLLVTLVLGLISLFLWLGWFWKVKPWVYWNIGFGFIILIVLCIWGYYSLNRSDGIGDRIPFLRDQIKSFSIQEPFTKEELHSAVLLSFLRYFIFTHQYVWLLFGFLGTEFYFPTLLSLGVIFMVQSIIPSFVLSDLGIRGANAVFFLSFVFGKQNIIPILATSFLVWMINIIVPAIIGVFFILKIKPSFGRP